MKAKTLIKDLIGNIPFTAEIDWALRHRDQKIQSRFNLTVLETRLPEYLAQVAPHANSDPAARKVFFFASSHYWIVHTALCGLALRGLGYDVTLGYLPYGNYDKPINRFDLRVQELYARHVMERAHPLLKTVSFLGLKSAHEIPETLVKAVEKVTIYDTQYTRQREDVTGNEPIYHLRSRRNNEAARKAYAYLQKNRPDVVVVPNGMIQEYGAVYETARALGITAVTYEFSELDQHVWIDQNRLVMFHFTDELWAECRERVLNDAQRTWLDTFMAGRQGAEKVAQFAHLWQRSSREGGEKIRSMLGLDQRPVVLLPTNVLGDSATLGRTIFSESMEDWIKGVLRFFANRIDVQLVIRIHPAETWTVGPSVAEIIHSVLPDLPQHFHLIGSTEKINTYDLMEIADLGLVYTTTAGLEMATRGIPVLVSGAAQYRKKGFTLDADSWEEYFDVLDRALKNSPECRLKPEQIERAWNYAYFYFREYPLSFPWHLEKVELDLEERPISYVLSPDGRRKYEDTFQKLAGAPIHWESR
ncbi:MAG TPA: hypothetical protein VII93_14910 [Anaerolineales bacterium]